MQLAKPLTSSRLYYRTLQAEDAEGNYQHWVVNPIVNQYLEVRHQPPTVPALKEFIIKNNHSEQNLLLGIFLNNSHQHIGNIKVGPIQWRHKRCTLGLLIGEPDQWGQGYGTEAIRTVTAFCINNLKLQRIEAGCYQQNKGSYHAFIKAGFKEEARLAQYWAHNDGFEDHILMTFFAA